MAKSSYIRLINFRTLGNFLDLHPIYRDVEARRTLVDDLCTAILEHSPKVICGVEAQGYILATAVAMQLGLPLVAMEKCFSDPSLPSYTLETRDFTRKWKRFSLRKDALQRGDRCVLIDDWIETGSQVQCAMDLIAQAGSTVVVVAALHAEGNAVTGRLSREGRLICLDR